MPKTREMAVDVSTRFQQLDSIPDLSTIIVKECANRNIPFEPKATPLKPTESEVKMISQKNFPKELDFHTNVNLNDSKLAFQALMRGLTQSSDVLSLWKSMGDCNPLNHPHPIGDLDVSHLKLLAQKEKP